MSVNENLVTVKIAHPDPDVNNTEATMPVDQYEDFVGYVNKYKGEGFTLRTLNPRNKYGAAGMPIDVKREKLLAQLAELEKLEAAATAS